MSNSPKHDDIKTGWLNIARRMQSKAKSNGLSIIVAKILVKADGTPVTWEVNSRELEPKSLQHALLDIIDEDDI